MTEEREGLVAAPGEQVARPQPEVGVAANLWASAVCDEAELLDLVTESIGDSLDMDWQPRDGARAVVSALLNAGAIRFGDDGAPELLAALKLAESGLDFFFKRHPSAFAGHGLVNARSLAEIRAAIAKAEGRAQ